MSVRALAVAVVLAGIGCSSSKAPAPPLAWSPLAGPLTDDLASVAFGSGIFVIGGGRGNFASSRDGIAWTKETSIPGSYAVGNILFDGTRFLVNVQPDGKAPVPSDTLYEAPAVQPLVFRAVPRTAAYTLDTVSGGVFYGTNGHDVGRSADGVAWLSLYHDGGWDFGAVAVGGGVAAAIGSYPKLSPLAAGRGAIFRSTDEVTWSRIESKEFESPDPYTGTQLNSVAYGGGRFVAASPAWILTSPDALTWTRVSTTAGGPFFMSRYAEGRFWITGAAGTLASSIDGIEFNLEKSNTDAALSDVAAGNGVAVAVGARGTIVLRKL